MASSTLPNASRVPTGIAGLDDILAGGLPRNRIHLIQGDPGTGKTTLALQFLLAGIAHGERGLYVTLSETDEEIRAVAESHGWSLDALSLCELSSVEASLKGNDENTLFNASDVELHETTSHLLKEVERVAPVRVVFDSLSELRLMAQSPLRYRRQILALKQFFAGRKCTVLLLDDRTSQPDDLQLQSLAHGVVLLEQNLPLYGAERRRLRVLKMRGVKFRGGYHDFQVLTGGLHVYPRLVASEYSAAQHPGHVTSGTPPLDRLLGGGLDRGTSTLIMGPAGSGKTVLASRVVDSASARGETCAMFTFEERAETLFKRCAALGIDLRAHVDAKRLQVHPIHPAEVSPGHFDFIVREAVEKSAAKVIVLDSLNGYLKAMAEERFLALQMHELLTYLGRRGVVTLLIVAQQGMLGATTPVDVSYLADTVVLLRFFEAAGKVRRAISVTKRRAGAHEDTIRELTLGDGGIHVGRPLTDFHGVLTGVPTYTGRVEQLGGEADEQR
jgi:circadian clock protein KaiC